jgi:hypothetical protein
MSEQHEPTPKKPVDFDELFPGRFLKAGLLGGKNVTLRITAVDVEPLPQDDGRDRKRGIISFAKTDMQLVMNSTNGQCLRAMFGRKVQEWVGKSITLRPDRDRFGRETVDCIRIAGSPDIAATMTCEISLPRKKPRTVTLEKTGAAPAAAAQPRPASGATREPGSDDA